MKTCVLFVFLLVLAYLENSIGKVLCELSSISSTSSVVCQVPTTFKAPSRCIWPDFWRYCHCLPWSSASPLGLSKHPKGQSQQPQLSDSSSSAFIVNCSAFWPFLTSFSIGHLRASQRLSRLALLVWVPSETTPLWLWGTQLPSWLLHAKDVSLVHYLHIYLFVFCI